jgi:cyclic pyranopterin phosphate synthase
MINIGDKKIIPRCAEASGRIYLSKKTLDSIIKREIKKGNPLDVAQIAAIQAVKKTPDIIPMCHNIPIDSVTTDFTMAEAYIEAHCRVDATYKTGVEMEALTGVTVALLTIWDMVKYIEKDENGQYPDTRISEIKVDRKTKGKE